MKTLLAALISFCLLIPAGLYADDFFLNSYSFSASCTPGSESIVPDGTTSSDWPQTGSPDSDCTGDCDYINEDDTSFYLNTAYGSRTGEFTAADTSSMGAACTTTSIVCHAKTYANDASYQGTIEMKIKTGAGSWQTSAEGAQQTTQGSWITLDYTFSTTWSKSEVDALSMQLLSVTDAGSENDRVGYCYCTINY